MTYVVVESSLRLDTAPPEHTIFFAMAAHPGPGALGGRCDAGCVFIINSSVWHHHLHLRSIAIAEASTGALQQHVSEQRLCSLAG